MFVSVKLLTPMRFQMEDETIKPRPSLRDSGWGSPLSSLEYVFSTSSPRPVKG